MSEEKATHSKLSEARKRANKKYNDRFVEIKVRVCAIMISLRVIILWCKASVGRFDATKFIVNRVTSKKVCNHCTLVCNHCILSLPLGTNTPILQWIPARTACRSLTVQIIINMTKAELEKKKDLARSLFLSGMEQAEIAEKVDVSRVTIDRTSVV